MGVTLCRALGLPTLAMLALSCVNCSFGRINVERSTDPGQDLTLNFRITDEAFADPLVDVSTMILWTDSTLLISDQDRLLTIGVGTGKPMRSIGRRGDGPGEFREISWTSALLGDTIVVFDGERDRFTYVVPGMKVARTHSYQHMTDTETVNPVCAIGTGQIAAIVRKTRPPMTRGVQDRAGVLRLYDRNMKNPRLLDSLTLSPLWGGSVQTSRGAMRLIGRIPFAPRLSVQCSRSAVYWGDGTRSSVRRFQHGRVDDLQFDGLRSEPISRATREAFLDSVTHAASGQADQLDDAEISRRTLEAAMEARSYESLPFYQEIRVGADEGIWVLSPRLESDFKVWHAYRADGSPATVVRVPAAFYLRAISTASLWGVARGPDDLPEIRSYSR